MIDQLIIDHPEWTGRRVTLICGPPASGKSTLARELHANVLELEQFTGTPRERMRAFGRTAYYIGRNLHPDHAVVRGGARQADRDRQTELCKPSRTIVLLTPADVCHARIDERGRNTKGGEHEAVDLWWQTWNTEPHLLTSRAW